MTGPGILWPGSGAKAPQGVGGMVWIPSDADGQFKYPLPEKPGLGFDLSDDALKKYPFPGMRPMVRVFQKDGSVAEW